MEKENEAMIERLAQAFSDGDMDVVDKMVSPCFIGYHPLVTQGIHGPEGLKSFFASIREAMPDASHPSWVLISDGELVAMHTPLEGTFSHTFMGISPNKKKGVLWMANIWRIVDGKIIEAWFTLDTLGLLPQLGLIPYLDNLE